MPTPTTNTTSYATSYATTCATSGAPSLPPRSADGAGLSPAFCQPDSVEHAVDQPVSLARTPTDRWLAATAGYMPALTGPAGTAERLLLLVHYGIDWQTGWVGRYHITYWDQLLPDRVITATYRAPTLRRWWRDVATELASGPRNATERAELEQLLRTDSLPVLDVLRWETEALLLRTRIVTDAVRDARPTTPEA